MRLIDAEQMCIGELDAYNLAQEKINDPMLKSINKVVHEGIQMLLSDAPTVDAVEIKHIRVMYNALLDVYKNELHLFRKYSIFGEHSDYEKMAFNNSGDNMQNLGTVIGTLEELMEEAMDREKKSNGEEDKE